ncbi:MAG: NADH:flavin oxidoreductase/NADH oxidase family protein [Halobacteriovoraceae bacterium]|nr:NADH:flavin oxidoreductase/NADH oxidase family protein [Halobacteriovoraceae bacterium]
MKLNDSLPLPCGAVLKNRIGKSAMSENMADKSNFAGGKFSTLYHTWAAGGAGLLISGNIMIDSKALGEPHNVILEKGHEGRDQLKAWAASCSQQGAALWGQLNHPGKQSPKFLSPVPFAPSAKGFPAPMDKMFNVPKAMTEEEIQKTISDFAYAASVLKECGFSGVQIHGAHGYLVSQFLSPVHNQRQDRYGGSLENRMRFALEVYHAIREAVGASFPVGIKLNSADFQKGGFSQEDSMLVVKELGDAGIDLIEISGGTYEAPKMMGARRDSTVKREAYFLDYCQQVRELTSTPLMLTGGFRTPTGMTEALSSGACDLIGLARSIALEPDFPRRILAGEDCKSLVHPLTSGSKLLDKLVPLEIIWYTEQIHRLGRGKVPKPKASPKLSVLRTLFSFGTEMLKPVRAK